MSYCEEMARRGYQGFVYPMGIVFAGSKQQAYEFAVANDMEDSSHGNVWEH